MTRPGSLQDVEVLLIDGNNLLHRLAGGIGDGARRSVLAKLRAVLSPGMQAIVMLDGHPPPGSPHSQRIDRSLEVRHAGGVADEALVGLVKASPPTVRGRMLAVTDDRALTERLRAVGARTARLAWLTSLLEGPLSAGGGLGRPMTRMSPSPAAADEEERVSWQPGRGATRKCGNPRRAKSGRRRSSSRATD